MGPSSLARAPGRRSCGCSWAEIARLHAGVELARPRATRPLACGGKLQEMEEGDDVWTPCVIVLETGAAAGPFGPHENTYACVWTQWCSECIEWRIFNEL